MKKTFKISISRRVKKWVIKDLLSDQRAPFKIEEDSLLGRHIAAVLCDPRRDDFINKALDLDDTIEIVISAELAALRPTDEKLTAINLYLDKAFRHAMFSWLKAMREMGVRPFNGISYFLDYYKITEQEYKKESAYQCWNRYKNGSYKSLKKRLSKDQILNKNKYENNEIPGL